MNRSAESGRSGGFTDEEFGGRPVRKPGCNPGSVLIRFGILMVACALALFLWNMWQDWTAGDAAAGALVQLREELSDDAEAFADDGERALMVVDIDGYGYIGYLSIPDLELVLPVMSEWDYDRLKISPCRYYGSVYTDDMVICAHNYDRHFGRLKNLTAGAKVTFTDMDGGVWTYEVASVMTYQPTDVEQMISGDYELMLFTCTYGGKTRVAVGCTLVSPAAGYSAESAG